MVERASGGEIGAVEIVQEQAGGLAGDGEIVAGDGAGPADAQGPGPSTTIQLSGAISSTARSR
jgi:hypothetical protein